MALNSIFDLSQTAGSNTDFGGTSVLGTGLVSTADDSFRTLASMLAKWRDDIGGTAAVSGTNTITATLNQTFTALANGQLVSIKAANANTGAATFNPSSLGAKAVRLQGDIALVGGEMQASGIYLLRYDTSYNSAAGAWVLLNPALTSSNNYSNAPFSNLSLTASVGASALTIALKGADGNDPSATNPVYVSFRSATATSGANSLLAVTAATSIVVSSGSTLGMTSAVAATLAIVAFNDAGTFRLGIINPNTYPIIDGIASSTAEGGAGAADSAGVYYTGTAVTSKAFTVIGFATVTEATAGTWASVPTTLQVANSAVVNNVYGGTGTTTPTVTAQAGTFTTVSAAIGWTRIGGNRVTFDALVTITTVGTASSNIILPLPFTAANTFGCGGRESSITGNAVACSCAAGSANLSIGSYDGTTIIGAGRTIVISGSYRI